MRKFAVVMILMGCLTALGWSRQVSVWRSSSGSTVKLDGTEKEQFAVIMVGPDGSRRVFPGQWVEVRNSFTYFVAGRSHYCTFSRGGYSIQVRSPVGSDEWSFVGWESR
ncbi:MAG: hypothetical protein AB7S38_06555 [Vulcanimicrobiota bacterium]